MAISPKSLRSLAGRSGAGLDPDAATYIRAVESADAQQLETGVCVAVHNFVVGCKADGIWSAIKASCILMGARTLSGALTPLVGTGPTNNNFVSGDYNRKTGLIGNGSTKYLSANRSTTADGQNDVHLAVYQSAAASATTSVYMTHIGAVQVTPSVVGTHIAEGFVGDSTKITRCRSTNPAVPVKNTVNNANGLQGISRSASGSYTFRAGATNTTTSQTSTTQSALDYYVLAQNNDNTVVNHSNARLAYYSIGSNLDLALLDSRLATLYTAIGAAIP